MENRKVNYRLLLSVALVFVIFLSFNSYLSANMVSTAIKKATSCMIKRFKQSKTLGNNLKNTGRVSSRVISNFDRTIKYISRPVGKKPFIRYPGLSKRLAKENGSRAIGVLNKLNRGNAQRLAVMSANGSFNRMGRTKELLVAIEKWSDKAMNFIWKHKKSLAIATVLTTFLKDPNSYFKGAKTLIVDPVVEPVKIAVKQIDWNLIISMILFMIFLLFGLKKYFKRKKKHDDNST